MAKFIIFSATVLGAAIYGAALYRLATAAMHTATSLAIAYLAICAGMSLLAFAAVGLDKWIATGNRTRRNRNTGEASRVPERILHTLELAGGWAGSLIAQRLFWHKVSKFTYQLLFWATGLFHLLAVVAAGLCYAQLYYVAAGFAVCAILQLVAVWFLAEYWKKQAKLKN